MPEAYRQVGFAVIGVCALMILVNLGLYKRRGISSLFLAAAFAILGAIVYAIISALSTNLIYGLGALLVVLLIADAFARQAKRQSVGK
jgi:hypothetical protein